MKYYASLDSPIKMFLDKNGSKCMSELSRYVPWDVHVYMCKGFPFHQFNTHVLCLMLHSFTLKKFNVIFKYYGVSYL